MTQLSKYARLGCAREGTPGTYLPPTFWLPFDKADYEDVILPIRDESYRGNDSVLQGQYAGPTNATWDLDLQAYPDLIGHMLRGMIGPDTVTAGVSTTLSAATVAGATSISTAVSIPAGSTIAIDTAGLLEYAVTGTPSGAGPFTIPLTSPSGGLLKPHASGVTVLSATTHTFKQSAVPTDRATYSFTVYDTVDIRSYSGAAMSDLAIKIDPKAAVTFSPKFMAMPFVKQTVDGGPAAYTTKAPMLGWQWNMTNAGASSTRGLTLDFTAKRSVEDIHSSDGVQAPREIFAGPVDWSGSYKAIYENTTDLDLYLQYSQQPATALLRQPLADGGQSLALTMNKSSWSKGKRDLGSSYVQASFSIDGVHNATDAGALSAVLTNWQTTAY